jgi:hypothetical protein
MDAYNGKQLNGADANPWYSYRLLKSNFGSFPDTVSFDIATVNYGGESGVTSTTIVQNDVWTHVAGVYDGATMKIYINGGLENTVSVTGNLRESDFPMYIGKAPWTNYNNFNGQMDELRIWNVAKTQEQIQYAMNRGLAGNEAGLVAYWPFNDVAGSPTADDASTNSHTGTLYNGAALVADSSAPLYMDFTAQADIPVNSEVVSNPITVTGIGAAATVSITGGGYAISTDGGLNWSGWTTSNGTVNAAGEQVRVKQISSSSYATTTNAVLTIGTTKGFFSVTTTVAPPDSDGDGEPDITDGCPSDPAKITPGICGCGVADTDTDGDGTPDCNDGCPNDPAKTSPGACGCGVADTDTDGDGTSDCNDECPADPAKLTPGVCGCGVADTDTDGDGTSDCDDGCPNDPAKLTPGVCGCGVADFDTDGDGTPNCNDGCPADPAKFAPGVCGCGVADIDADGDGIPECNNSGGELLPPVADPGSSQTVDSQSPVNLDGAASHDPDGTIQSYFWEQTAGLAVSLTGANTPQASFVSPETEAQALLMTFALTVTDNDGLSSSASVTVTVKRQYEQQCEVPPFPIAPGEDAVGLSLMPLLVIDKFIDPVTCVTHQNTRWQISEDPEFQGLVYNRNVFEADPFSHQLPPGVLGPNTTYYWRANIDCSSGCASEYSATSSFTTGNADNDANGNGVPDDQELTGETDLDGDGQPDNQGIHFRGINTVVGNAYVAIETSANILFLQSLNNQDQDILEGMPVNMPWGLINFRIETANPGDTVQVTIYFNKKAPEGSVVYKYDPVEGWIDYTEHATFAPDLKSVTIEVQDGGFGDVDGAVNGVIVDPCGIGTTAAAGGGGGGGGCFLRALLAR